MFDSQFFMCVHCVSTPSFGTPFQSTVQRFSFTTLFTLLFFMCVHCVSALTVGMPFRSTALRFSFTTLFTCTQTGPQQPPWPQLFVLLFFSFLYNLKVAGMPWFLIAEIVWLSKEGEESFFIRVSGDGNVQELQSQLSSVIEGLFSGDCLQAEGLGYLQTKVQFTRCWAWIPTD